MTLRLITLSIVTLCLPLTAATPQNFLLRLSPKPETTLEYTCKQTTTYEFPKILPLPDHEITAVSTIKMRITTGIQQDSTLQMDSYITSVSSTISSDSSSHTTPIKASKTFADLTETPSRTYYNDRYRVLRSTSSNQAYTAATPSDYEFVHFILQNSIAHNLDFPERAIAIGDSWSVHNQTPILETHLNYTLLQVSETTYTLRCKGRITITLPTDGGNITSESEINSIQQNDRQTGLLIPGSFDNQTKGQLIIDMTESLSDKTLGAPSILRIPFQTKIEM